MIPLNALGQRLIERFQLGTATQAQIDVAVAKGWIKLEEQPDE